MQKVQVQLIDDTDGSAATETVSFGLDGTGYEIDLSLSNAAELRASVADYVDHARKANRVVAPRQQRNRVDTAVVRQWLHDNGHGDSLSDRGRIPTHLQERYDNRNQVPEMRAAEGPMPTRAEVSAIAAELQHFQPPQAPAAEVPPEKEAEVSAVIAAAKDEVRRQRRNQDKAPSATAPVAESTATASPTAEASRLKRPTQRGQRNDTTAKGAAKAETTIM